MTAYHTCADGTVVRSRASQEACVRGFQNRLCRATVGQVEECVRLQTQRDCTIATMQAPACQALVECAAQ
jgi:hypothetical protein